MRACIICEEPIHPARIAAQPKVKTCKRECSEENVKRVRARINKRWREERKAAKAAADARNRHLNLLDRSGRRCA